jgi:hypothetical protein
MVKVKYNGTKGVRLNKIDFYPGDVKEVSSNLKFPEGEFEVLKEKSEKVEKAPSKKKKSSKKE